MIAVALLQGLCSPRLLAELSGILLCYQFTLQFYVKDQKQEQKRKKKLTGFPGGPGGPRGPSGPRSP